MTQEKPCYNVHHSQRPYSWQPYRLSVTKLKSFLHSLHPRSFLVWASWLRILNMGMSSGVKIIQLKSPTHDSCFLSNWLSHSQSPLIFKLSILCSVNLAMISHHDDSSPQNPFSEINSWSTLIQPERKYKKQTFTIWGSGENETYNRHERLNSLIFIESDALFNSQTWLGNLRKREGKNCTGRVGSYLEKHIISVILHSLDF